MAAGPFPTCARQLYTRLQRGTGKDGGGAFLCALTNCVLNGNVATNGNGGGAIYGILANCLLNTNMTTNGFGGGACSNLLNNCFLTGNSANNGGGAAYSALNGCHLFGNSANMGGGAYYGSVVNCLLSSNNNAPFYGGGTCYANVTNSTITECSGYAVAYGICYGCTIANNDYNVGIYSNSAYGCLISSNFCGSFLSTLYNCQLTRNNGSLGGASRDDILNNCTVIGFNINGAGAYKGILNNCTVM